MTRFLFALALCFFGWCGEVVAQQQHRVGPSVFSGGYASMLYEHRDGFVRVGFEIWTGFQPVSGTVSTTTESGLSDEKQLVFSSSQQSSSWFMAAGDQNDFRQEIFVGDVFVADRLHVSLDVFGVGGESAHMEYEVVLLPFDFYADGCRLAPDTVAADITIFSFNVLPDTVDSVTIELEGGRMATYTDVPILSNPGDEFGYINIPVRWYERLMAGKRLSVTLTIGGEAITAWGYFPHMPLVKPGCDRG